MTTLVHISDLHFGREVSPVIEGLLESIADADPDHIIISGDLTQRARADQYKKGVHFLNRLPAPYLIIPGNHDLPLFNLIKRFHRPWGNWNAFVTREMAPVLKGDDFIAAGVNTARRWATLLDQTRGRINTAQTNAAITQLQNAPDDHLRILVAHHPFWLPEGQERRHLVGGRDQALASLKQARVDMILGGHLHIAYQKLLNGILVVHAGSGVSSRTSHQANSFNIIRGDRQRVTVDVKMWNGSIFEDAEHHAFVRRNDGWTAS